MSSTVNELQDCPTSAPRQAVDADTQQEVDRVVLLIDEFTGPELLNCSVCGRMGLPVRIVDHGQVVKYLSDRPVETAENGLLRVGSHSRYGFGELRVKPLDEKYQESYTNDLLRL